MAENIFIATPALFTAAFCSTCFITVIITSIFHIIASNCFVALATAHFLNDVLTVAFAFNRVVFVDLTKTKNISKMKNDNATV